MDNIFLPFFRTWQVHIGEAVVIRYKFNMKFTFIALSIFFVCTGCGEQTNKVACTPNFEGGGMSIKMQYLRDNSDGSSAYSIQMCNDSRPPGVTFSVYGGSAAETMISNPTSSVRLQRVKDSAYSGAQFEVNFKGFDTWFVIYLDRPSAGTYILDTTNEMVRGDLSLATYAGG
jgi:hypothetical protein